ncbi:MAG: translation initiation factor [Cyclobacteriaceae bacterium]
MSKKNKNKREGIVYSTSDDYQYDYNEQPGEETLPPSSQDLRVMLDKKARKGKQVTLIVGFVGTDDDLKELAKKLKSACGAGGTAKEGEIIIQGDFRDKVMEVLHKEGYKAKKSGG